MVTEMKGKLTNKNSIPKVIHLLTYLLTYYISSFIINIFHYIEAITQSFPVIVTSYEIAMNDIGFFKKFEIKSLIIDEGHRLKNYKCKMIKCLKELTASNIILLTGIFISD